MLALRPGCMGFLSIHSSAENVWEEGTRNRVPSSLPWLSNGSLDLKALISRIERATYEYLQESKERVEVRV